MIFNDLYTSDPHASVLRLVSLSAICYPSDREPTSFPQHRVLQAPLPASCPSCPHLSHLQLWNTVFLMAIWYYLLGFFFFLPLNLLYYICLAMSLIQCPVTPLIQLTLFCFLEQLLLKNVGLMWDPICRFRNTIKSPAERCLPAKKSRNKFCLLLAQVGPLPPPPAQGTVSGDYKAASVPPCSSTCFTAVSGGRLLQACGCHLCRSWDPHSEAPCWTHWPQYSFCFHFPRVIAFMQWRQSLNRWSHGCLHT